MPPRERDLVAAVARLTARNGWPPSIKELAAEIAVSTSRVKQLVSRCVDRQALHRQPGQARGLRVLTRRS
jgi:SOS-response transcriptional repressor LexA